MAKIGNVRTIYEGWTNFHVVDVLLEDASILSRAVEDHGNSVAVLPYDPVRKIAILVRQLRTPLLFAGADAYPLELPAGRADHGSSEASVRAEAMEEAGLRLSELRLVLSSWTMPGISTERADLYLAEFSDADRVTEGGGLAEEGEVLDVVEITLRDLAAMADRGALPELKVFALVMTLRVQRPELFA